MTKLATKSTVRATASRAPVLPDAKAKAIAPTKVLVVTGKLAVVRNAAIEGIATLSYMEGGAHDAVVRQIAIAAGKSPTAAELAGIAREYIVGRVAARLVWPEGVAVPARIIKAREIVTQYAAPHQDGKKAMGLRKGQTGRRTVAEHKAVRAAESAWSLVKADLGHSEAKGMKAKRAAQASKANQTKLVKAAGMVAPSHAELKGVPTAPVTQQDVAAYVLAQARTLAAYAKKNGKHVTIDLGTAVNAFLAAIEKEAAIIASVA